MQNSSDRDAAIGWHYDRIADEYKGLDQRTDRILARLQNLSEDSGVLDIGCATGNLTFQLPNLTKLRKVVGVDLSEQSLVLARNHATELGLANAEFKQGSACQLPCQDNEVDIVVSNMVYHLVADKVRAFSEIVRVLKPQGRAILKFMAGGHVMPEWVELIRKAWTEVLPTVSFPVLFHTISTTELEQILLANGIPTFDIERGHFVYRVEQKQVDYTLHYYGLVTGFWQHGLDCSTAEQIRVIAERSLRNLVASQQGFRVTLDSLMVEFTRP